MSKRVMLHDPKHRMAGPANPNWKGGRSVASNGYVLIKLPYHPDADVRGYVYEHRLVAEKKLGRRLRRGEEPHHKNEIRSDNRPRNIEVKKSKLHHGVEHRKPGSKRQRMPGEPNPWISCACGCGKKLRRYDQWLRIRRYISGHNNHG